MVRRAFFRATFSVAGRFWGGVSNCWAIGPLRLESATRAFKVTSVGRWTVRLYDHPSQRLIAVPFAQSTVFILGVVAGAALMGLGGYIGFLWGRRRGRRDAVAPIKGAELLGIIEALSRWTSEYSGNVSRYQNELASAAQIVQKSIDGTSVHDSPVVRALHDIMVSNRSLKTRLDDAERQLERQTSEIQSYLSEARTDPLTKLPNRRAFDQRLDEMFSAWQKGGPGFAVAMIDVDHFKQINDQYGHQEGDEVLRQVAQLLSNQLDKAFMVARFGGEEFVAIMPLPLGVAADRLDQFRKLVARQLMTAGTKRIKLTLSIGLSEARQDVLIGPIVRRADEALYVAKEMGRNRVYIHDGNQASLVGAPEVATRD